jgi:hypothetical protein
MTIQQKFLISKSKTHGARAGKVFIFDVAGYVMG